MRKPKQRKCTIFYRLNGKSLTWDTTCTHEDDEDTIMSFLHKHIPEATFVKVVFDD